MLLEIDEIEMAVLRAPAAPKSSPAACSRWSGSRWISTSRPATSTLLLVVGDPANGDPLLDRLRSGLTEHTAHCDVVSAATTSRSSGVR